MTIKQLSVFVENKQGKLVEVAKVLKENNLDIRALSIADTTNFGILRLILTDPIKAEQCLKEAGFTVSLTDVLAVKMGDHPGGLHGVLEILDNAKIDVEYVYAFVSREAKTACVILRVSDNDKAIELLKAQSVPMLSDASFGDEQ